MMPNPGGWRETSVRQPAVSFAQLDLDEIPEFRPRMASDDSGYSSSFQEVQCPPHCPQYPPYLHQTGPQFYLWSPCGNTFIPCEEIILSQTTFSPEGPVYPEVYQTTTEAYVAYPVQGPGGPGYITQPFTGPDISSSPSPPSEETVELQEPGKVTSATRPQSEQEDRRDPRPVKKNQPGIKQISKDVPVVLSRYIPGLSVENNKTKKRKKKKSKSKQSPGQLKTPTSSSDSEVRETGKDVEAPEAELKLTDDLTNSLVNPPTDEDEDTEVPINAQFSCSEAVLTNLSKSSKEISATPPETGTEKLPEKPSSVGKSKNKIKKKKPKKNKVKMDTEPGTPAAVKELDDGKSEMKSPDSTVSTEPASETLKDLELEEVKDEAEGETETTEDPVTLEELETQSRVQPSNPVKPGRKKKGRGRRIQSSEPPLKPVLVNDDEV